MKVLVVGTGAREHAFKLNVFDWNIQNNIMVGTLELDDETLMNIEFQTRGFDEELFLDMLIMRLIL